MVTTHYTVLEAFEDAKDYGIHIRAQHRKILQSLQKDQQITPSDFIESHMGNFGESKTKQATTNAVYRGS